ncbi:MAG: MarR family winged helix-turn-helix transcriptional regulator [Salibacteraceae bacterium]
MHNISFLYLEEQPMKQQKTVDFHIRWAWQRISRLYNNEAMKNGFTMSIGYVLLNIDTQTGTPSTKLGPKMGMEPRSLTRTLKSMEEMGLIERRPDPDDRRLVRVFLTNLGKAKRKVSRETVIRFNESLQGQIEPQKLSVFFEVIEHFNHLLDTDSLLKEKTT